MKGALSLSQAMDILRHGEPCDVTVCTLDLNRDTGGKRKVWLQARLLQRDNPDEFTADSTPAGEQPAKRGRNPNHKEHRTINLRLQNDEITKVHLPLIERINGQKVAL